ncbi:MAG: hypothetical protein L6V93_07305 [Clostridiales bacterium]|nr:MAG: hypothetical protein L6V93_07305 [Clostridiales bacterium]
MPKSCKLGAYVNIFLCMIKTVLNVRRVSINWRLRLKKITAPKKLAKLNEEKN